MDQKEHFLKIKSLTKDYHNGKEIKNALSNVSFTLDTGLYGLLGPNGAGKSTMIQIIVGNLNATEGEIFWNGKNILKKHQKFRRILGYMPQQQNLYDGFTGRRFLFYLAALKEVPEKEMKEEVERVAHLVHLTNELDKKLAHYSGGMKQRLLAACAMMGKPKLLIFDEPTAGLDPKERVHLRNILQEIAKKSIVIVATHVVSDVEHCAKEILLLKQGVLLDKAPVAELIEKYAPNQNLEQVYLSLFGEDDV